ncbi:hypothetical protein CH373_11615 [Leptospira perolatii]|uniref:Uncharacterized protein n=1 Tax=Leptospira perolatii TaxID=2023191 RepID=A0A2M9ZM91_9LEPT|nr:hypothetical protein [Leptospira perolatii]PJZ69121.1 hypothetical protein CH360_12650 [Leptospira perolatii]PJZ73135.1 hypothetical protein CH373_11615 [Leptospira perolatii]
MKGRSEKKASAIFNFTARSLLFGLVSNATVSILAGFVLVNLSCTFFETFKTDTSRNSITNDLSVVTSTWEQFEDNLESGTFLEYFPVLELDQNKKNGNLIQNDIIADAVYRTESYSWELDWEDPIVLAIRLDIVSSNLRFYYGFEVNPLELGHAKHSDPLSFSLILFAGYSPTLTEVSVKSKGLFSTVGFTPNRKSTDRIAFFFSHQNEITPNRKLTRYYSRLTHSDPDLRG